MTETKWGFKRAAIALMTPFIIGAIMMKFNETIAVKVGLLSMVIFGILWFFMYFDSGTKFVHFISRGKYDNPRQLLQNIDRKSYPAREAGAVSVAGNSPDHTDYRKAATGVRFASGHLSLQVSGCRTGGNLAETAFGQRI